MINTKVEGVWQKTTKILLFFCCLFLKKKTNNWFIKIFLYIANTVRAAEDQKSWCVCQCLVGWPFSDSFLLPKHPLPHATARLCPLYFHIQWLQSAWRGRWQVFWLYLRGGSLMSSFIQSKRFSSRERERAPKFLFPVQSRQQRRTWTSLQLHVCSLAKPKTRTSPECTRSLEHKWWFHLDGSFHFMERQRRTARPW